MAAEALERMRAYLAGRSPRERLFLIAGGAILLLLLVWGLLYEPQRAAREKLAERLPAERAELRLMRAQAAEIERLRKRGGDAGGGLEQRVKASAATFGVADSFLRFVSMGDSRIELATAPLPTATWSEWLADLERRGVVVLRCRITAAESAGMASLEMTLSGGQR